MPKRLLPAAALAALILATAPGHAAEGKVDVVASFSILADMAERVGGERVAVAEIVGPDGDAHVYEPTPADARAVTGADLVIVNGLGFEGWLERLIGAAEYQGPIVVASEGVAPLSLEDEEHARGAKVDEDHGHGAADPHAWQSLANGKIYVANIAKALKAADPAGAATYDANAAAYLEEIAALDRQVRESISALPAERRKIVTSHDAFAYLADAYGLEVLAPQGVSTESEASAADVARLIRQIREQRIPAVFVESISDPRLIEQITRETGARVGGALYSDALSGTTGPAPTYLAMFRHNLQMLLAALTA